MAFKEHIMANEKNSVPALDYMQDAAKKIKAEIISRADGYLEGTYDPKAEAKKTLVKGTTTALLALSIITGLAFSGPAEINEDQAATQLNPAPVVMDIDDYMNTGVDDDDDADEQKGTRPSAMARFKQAVLSLPSAVKLLIVTPLWALGTGIMTAVSFLWNVIFASPLGAFIASFAVGFAVLIGLFAVTTKVLFPWIPLRKILSKKSILALGITALALAGADAAMPVFWHDYPLYAAALKIGVSIFVITLLANRLKKLNPMNALKAF